MKKFLIKIVSFFGKFIYSFRKKKKLPEKTSRILIISLYFRGDLLFHTPVIKALKKIYPEAEIDVWCKSRSREVLLNNPDVNEIIVFDRIRTADYGEENNLFFNKKRKFLNRIRESKYDIALDLTGKYSTALFCLLGKIKYSAGINYNGFGFFYNNFIDLNTQHTKGHLTDKYLEILRRALLLPNEKWNEITDEEIIKPVIYLDENSKKEADEELTERGISLDKDLITIHTTSGWEAKQLPQKTFIDLIKMLKQEFEHYIILVGHKNDESYNRRILTESGLDPEKHFIASHLHVTAQLINRSSVFIGSDSVPLHIAGALDVPSVALFGPTNPEFSRPRGEKHKLIYNKLSCSSPDSEQYCTRNAGKTCPVIECMNMISAKEIFNCASGLIEIYSEKKAVNG